MTNPNTLRARIEDDPDAGGQNIVLYREDQPDTVVVTHNVAIVLASYGGDMRDLLSTFEYSARLGLPLDTGTPQGFGAQLHQNKLYDLGRTSDDDRFDD